MSTNLFSAEESTIVDVGSEASCGSQRIDLRIETPAMSLMSSQILVKVQLVRWCELLVAPILYKESSDDAVLSTLSESQSPVFGHLRDLIGCTSPDNGTAGYRT
jgi:hypothetical protein